MNHTDRPLFHGKVAIFVFTTLLSAFFGSLLYSQNLKEIGRRKDIPPTIIFGLIWNFLSSKLLTELSVTNTMIRLFIPNLLAGLLLITVFWNYHFKGVEDYKTRTIWIPLIIFILVYGLFIILNIVR